MRRERMYRESATSYIAEGPWEREGDSRWQLFLPPVCVFVMHPLFHVNEWKLLCCVWLFATLWTSMEFSYARIMQWVAFPFSRIFPTQGSNTGLPHCRQLLYQLSHKGSPRILEWVAYPFSSGSSRPRNWTGVSCIAGRFFTSWATMWLN